MLRDRRSSGASKEEFGRSEAQASVSASASAGLNQHLPIR